ncbi:hypothetical protein [Luteipulveratus halotolerans]|uniref:hypothetical protein n=1 Tax=Luteipulveratus halotolerans TaxID=1631356 RepID=UPI001E4E74FB|nr:hypothetical protein [Luteipulveratus halotolerans]
MALERELMEQVEAAIADEPTTVGRMMLAIGAVLDACSRPELVRIALLDAPSVLGWQAWRAVESEYGLQLVTDLLRAGVDEGVIAPGPGDTLAHIVLGSVIECALLIAHADDPAAARQEAETSLGLLLNGLLVPT